MSEDDVDVAIQEQEDPMMTKKSGYWTRLKKKWNRCGVVEIDIDHHAHNMLMCISEGLRDLLTNHTDLGPKEELDTSDYNHVLHSAITAPNGKIFHFASYASPVFATIRQAIGLSEADFFKSICPESKPYLEFISNSKSGQSFYLSNDKAYFMKTDKKYAIDFLINILGDYLDHFLKYPHSLIVKYIGLFSVRMEGGSIKYFYIMQSIFYPDERIEKRYDVKGCLAGRYQKPAEPSDDPVIEILKDRNFLQETIHVGPQRDWLMKQIKYDAHFMKSLGVQDYSLLVGTQQLHVDEKTQDLGDIVKRVQQSMPQPKSKPKATEHIDLDDVNTTEPELNQNNCNSNKSPEPDTRTVHKRPTLGRGHGLSFYKRQDSESAGLQNRRLLPKMTRPLHIIDGPQFRYFIGIIDFFTLYECRQKTGRILKSIKFGCRDHSTVPPDRYSERFIAFLNDHVE